MKSIINIAAVFIFLIPSKVKADLGSCAIYHAKFYLKDGSIFNGCFQLMGYENEAYLDKNGRNSFCNDDGVLRAFKLTQKKLSNKVPVYKRLYTFHPKSIFKSNNLFDLPSYGFAIKDDTRKIDSSEISNIIFWKAEECKNDWLTSELVLGNQEMIDTLQNKKYWNDIYLDLGGELSDTLVFDSLGTMGGYHLINYSPRNNVEEIKRLAHLKLKFLAGDTYTAFKKRKNIPDNEDLSKELKQLYYDELYKKIYEAKKWLWQKGILMIRVNGTC